MCRSHSSAVICYFLPSQLAEEQWQGKGQLLNCRGQLLSSFLKHRGTHRTASNLFPQALNRTQAEFSQTGGSCQPFFLPSVCHPHQGQSTGLHVLLNPHPSAPFGGTGKSSFPLRASTGNNGANETTILSSSWLEGMRRAERYLTGQHRENQLHESSWRR